MRSLPLTSLIAPWSPPNSFVMQYTLVKSLLFAGACAPPTNPTLWDCFCHDVRYVALRFRAHSSLAAIDLSDSPIRSIRLQIFSVRQVWRSIFKTSYPRQRRRLFNSGSVPVGSSLSLVLGEGLSLKMVYSLWSLGDRKIAEILRNLGKNFKPLFSLILRISRTGAKFVITGVGGGSEP